MDHPGGEPFVTKAVANKCEAEFISVKGGELLRILVFFRNHALNCYNIKRRSLLKVTVIHVFLIFVLPSAAERESRLSRVID